MVKLLNIIIALCIVLGASAHRRNVDNFAGRSGQMIVELPEENIHDDSALLFKGDYFNNMDIESMKDVQFMDLFAQVAGIPTANVEGSHEGFPSSSILSKPMASLIVSIAGAGSEALEQSKNMELFQGIKEIPLTTTSYPLNTHAVLNTMATGTSPSVHGIVGRTWSSPNGKKVNAHEKGAQAIASNIADILLQQYNGQSLVVSASASHSYSSIFAAHSGIARAGWNAHAYSLTDKFHFLSNYPHPQPVLQVFALQHTQMQSVLTGAGFNSLFSTTYSAPSSMTFDKVSFDLKTKADSKLFAELAFVYNFIEKLKTEEVTKLVNDEVPDLFAITFSGLKRIATKYGEGSQQYSAALQMINKAATALSEAIDDAYAHKTATIFAYVNPHHSIPSEIKQSAYLASRADMSMQDFEKNFPAIYTSPSSSSSSQCVNLQRDLGLPVHCFSAASPVYDFYTYVMDNNGSSGNNSANNTIIANRQAFKDVRYLMSFWILFFIAIILISFVGWGVYNLTFVGGDASRDSLLYRVSSRHHHQL